MDNRPIIQCGAFWATFVAEREALAESMREVGRIASLGDKPLVVLSRDPNPQVGWGSATLRSKLGEDAGRASEPLLTGSAIRCARCNSLHPE